MRNVAVLVVGLAGACSSAQMHDPTAVDAGATDAASADGPPIDGAPDDAPAPDAAPDAATDATPDAALDGPPCSISAGHTIALDGNGDLAEYPVSQRIVPGAPVAQQDEVGITWDPTYLYLTVRSEAFIDGARPLHLYLEAKTDLADSPPSQGKEYSGLIAELPFSPNYLIAARGTNDFGTGPYDGVYLPGGAAQPWTTMSTALVPGTDVFVSSDLRTLSVRTPWSALGGCPLELRAALHVVNIDLANEWKDLVPSTHTPWLAPGGGFYEIALTDDPAVSGWLLH